MKPITIFQRFVPFVLAFALGIAVTLPLRTNTECSDKPTDSKILDTRAVDEPDNNHDFKGPYLPPLSTPGSASGKAGTQPLKILSKPPASFTDRARAHEVEGTVRLEVTLLASGAVGSIQVVNGLPDGLTEQAIAAARRLQFSPATVDGVPVSKTVTIDYRFGIY